MKVKWALLSNDEQIIGKIKPIAKKNGKSFLELSSVEEVENTLKLSKNIVLILDSNNDYDVYELCGHFSISFPTISVILLLPEEKVDIKKAMYVRAIDVITSPVKEEDFFVAIHKAESMLEYKYEKLPNELIDEENYNGKVLTVCSTKGGVGKTVLGVNLATSLSLQGKKTVIIDLDLQFGDVSVLFDVNPEKTIYDWVKESFEQSDGEINEYLSKHSTGVDILACPNLPEFAETITGKHIDFLIQLLKKRYDYIIIDTPPVLIETALVAYENCDEILLIASMDLPTLKNGKLAVDTLELLGLKENIKVILNRDVEMEGMKYRHVESIIDIPIYTRIPSDYKVVVTSINSGKPFVYENRHTKISQSIKELSTKIIGVETTNPKKRKTLKIKSLFTNKKGKR